MNEFHMPALDAADPMGFMAALGVLRVISLHHPDARLFWVRDGHWSAVLRTTEAIDPVEVLFSDAERWRAGHPAVDFAVGAERKVQDLKHPPAEFRTLLLHLASDPEAAEFAAAYATGVATDGSGQTKPTSFHLTAGQQRFMDVILSLRSEVSRDDIVEALNGPWIGRSEPKDPRWRAASQRSRALLWFDPGASSKGTAATTITGAAWLAFQAMPLFPVVPIGRRAVTTGFTGHGKNEQFTWPVWEAPITLGEVRGLLGWPKIGEMKPGDRQARGIVQVFRSAIVRSSQGYGNFSAARPV